MEPKPELQRVLEARKREQRGRQKRQEEEARRKVSPLEQELMKRQKKLEEVRGDLIIEPARKHARMHACMHARTLHTPTPPRMLY